MIASGSALIDPSMAGGIAVRLTANFERNLEEIEAFLEKADAPQAYDRLLDELLETVIPNLERFPAIGRSFLDRPLNSVETTNAQGQLRLKLQQEPLREYSFADYLLLYAQSGEVVHLLAIKHHRQISFDFQSLWPGY